MEQFMENQHSIALDYNGSTCIDISQSDTLPSISFDENNCQGKDFFFKELHDKISRLREENFDLKMKIYLMESNENSGNSEFKLKVLKELDRKNEEIKNLKQIITNKNKENINLKRLYHQHIPPDVQYKQENNKLRAKLLELFHLYSDLYHNANELKDLMENNQNKMHFMEKLNSSAKIIQRTSEFLTENSLDPIEPIIPTLENKSTQTDSIVSHKINYSQQIYNNEEPAHSLQIIVQDLKHCLDKLRKLIQGFRNNEINYKSFLSQLDQIFETIQNNQCFEKIQTNQFLADTANDLLFKQGIYSALRNQLEQLEKMNLKSLRQ